MNNFRRLSSLLKIYSEKDKRLVAVITQITGSRPFNLNLYKLATRHTSASEESGEANRNNNNERLEYLGDAILGAIIAEYLFKKFPFKDEGFLTEIRSRIVNRESLNNLAKKIGLNNVIEYDTKRRSQHTHKSIYGDALEALVGAVYLDKGYEFSRKFVLNKLIAPHLDIKEIIAVDTNYKSRLIEWAQRENQEIRFEIIQETGNQHTKEFVAQVFLKDEPFATGSGYSKKKAEQAAASKACEKLKLDNPA